MSYIKLKLLVPLKVLFYGMKQNVSNKINSKCYGTHLTLKIVHYWKEVLLFLT